jgi:chitinase
MPLYGRTFTLSRESDWQVGAPANGPGQAGQYTREPGFIGYNEFCENMKTQSWTLEWSNEQHTPYAHKGNQWIGYDNVQSLAEKVKFMMDLGLGGSMVWSLETDDFRDVCGQGAYPLMNTIVATMNGGETPPPMTTTQPPPTTPTTTTTRDPTAPTNPPGECKEDGTFRDPNDCSKYFICAQGQRFDFQCPPPLMFNDKSKVCDWPENVEC